VTERSSHRTRNPLISTPVNSITAVLANAIIVDPPAVRRLTPKRRLTCVLPATLSTAN
jgi:hypothetical protein